MTNGWLVRLAALSGAVAVIAGAFGAHGVTGKPAEWLRTGGEYELIHAVATIVAVQLGIRWAAALLLGGSVLFAVTLYAMALGAPSWLGAVTPLGGLGMILGWLLLAGKTTSNQERRP
ncbi:DUF423 domain-containing protein [Sphingomonas crusticola]|uniref:DUF423 domain-containing protein n=1 Tax=Sphingomonas crusticola TaxID=1697973 RepID=UPI000E268A1F|nr:DUF423 domain-containing protein [Sphingomonas crusticola]